MKYICPSCKREVDPEHFACKSGAKGGKSGTGESKARTTEQARNAALARWRRKKGWKDIMDGHSLERKVAK